MTPEWAEQIDWDKPVTEDDVWQAIADHLEVDVNEIADGDLVDYL